MPRQLKQAWYDALLKCASSHTEAPDRFIVWSAFSVLGAVLKNRVFIRDGLFTLYPNQYIVLVSPPGIGKGTAINFAWGIIRDTAPNFLANMVSDRVTAPRILERIANGWNSSIPSIVNGQVIIGGAMDHTATICSTELRVLTSASDWMLEFLCESWDRNTYDYDTKNKGSSFIVDMCTSLISGTVPDYLKGIDHNSDISIKGGFTSRCLFVYEDEPSRYMPFPPPIGANTVSMATLAALKNDLEHIAHTLKGEFTYDTDARLKFEIFLKNVRSNAGDNSEAVANFKARIRAHTLKLAMVVSAARKDDLVITGIDMDIAIGHIKLLLKDIEKIFRGAGESELASSTAKVEAFVEKFGMASKKEILKHLHQHMTSETIDRIIWVLTEIGHFTTVTQNKITFYKPSKSTSPNGRVKP